MADVSAITFTQDPTSSVVTMVGNARGPVLTDVAFHAVLATGEEFDGTVKRPVESDLPTALESFTDDHGGVWAVSQDGRTATPPGA